MTTIKRSAIGIGMILALLFVLQSQAWAQNRSSPAPLSPGEAAVAPRTVTTSGQVTLQSSVIQSQPCCTSLNAGYNKVFTTTIACASVSCTFGFEDMIQIGPTSTNAWAICAQVNTTFVNPPCPYQGIGIPGYYSVGTSLQSYGPVGPGTYTLNVYVYISAATGASLGNSEAIYRLYTP
jgi:hypothetical protein